MSPMTRAGEGETQTGVSCTITSCLEQRCGHVSLCAQCPSVCMYLSFPRAPSLPFWLHQLPPPPGDSIVV